ncbi:MAG: S8 family peptidase, partial [Flavisolibacter sp.]
KGTQAQKTIEYYLNKVSPSLSKKISTNSADSITVSIRLNNPVNFLKEKKSLVIIQTIDKEKILIGRIALHDLIFILDSKNVDFVNEYFIPKEELTTGAYDLSLNRINYVHSRFPLIAGDSVNAAIKERMFDTTDIDLKGRVLKTGLEASTQTPHASSMTTIIAGGANSSPFAKGAAWKSNVASTSFLNLFADTDSVLIKNKISIQNHSYGTIVENFYGNEAVSYDAQSNRLPFLLHVFSAGNSGDITNSAGPYTGIPNHANLSGNFKHAKNIIIVGSVDSSGQIMPLSSKGPAYDGRVKPELVAYGEDGSSGAAALVSGAALLVQDTYKKKYGNLPNSSLVKSVLLNSANDNSNEGIDYVTGYGSLNAYKAVKTINENRIIEKTIAQNETKNFNLVIPSGISQLKITIAWNDPVASANSIKALVNDVDIQLSLLSTGEIWLPWVLDPSPNLIALQAPAQRKTDTLNNVEQISLNFPAPGTYMISVNGSKINTGNQDFSIAFQLDSLNEFFWTYPTSNDPLITKNAHWLRWETNLIGQCEIEYATDGNNWRAIATPDLSKKYYRWTLPDTVANAVLRMKILSTGATVLSDSFAISAQLNMQVGFNCPDSFLLHWNSLPPKHYRLYELGNKYLEAFAQTTDTSVLLRKFQHPSIYYAVAPAIGSREGIRSNTINYISFASECYLKSFFLQSQTSVTATFTAELGTLFNVTSIQFEKLSSNRFVVLRSNTNPTTLTFNFTDSLLKEGENHYRVAIRLANGNVIYSNVEIVYALPNRLVFLYPNPVDQANDLNVISNESGRFTLQVFDNSGRIIYKKLLTSNITRIYAGMFPKGLYVARIIDVRGKPFTQKFIIQ